MEEKLRAHVMSLFEGAPKTKQMIEVREEILTNVRERYRDLIESGASPEEAYEISKRSIGNLDEVMKTLEEQEMTSMPTEPTPEEMEARKRKSALNGVATALFILSPVCLIAFSSFGLWLLGLISLFVCIAAGAGLKVYADGVYQPVSHPRFDDGMMEEFKAWHATRNAENRQVKLYEGIMWPLIVAAYFIISFMTQAWYITWVIFLIGGALSQLLRLIVNK